MNKPNPEQREAETVEMLKNIANYGSGPAYPQQMQWTGADQTSNFWFAVGLTKREQIAAMAMQGLLSDGPITEPDKIAKKAVQQADALLEWLKPNESPQT